MPLWALWRRNWAVWMMPITGLVVATWNNTQLPFFDHYPYWVAAQKTGALIILGMATSIAGAAEGAWQRRGRLNEQPTGRGLLVRFGLPILMAWLPTALLLMIGITAVGGIAAWQLWLTSLISLFAWTCLGMALGALLRPVIALPVSVLAAFGWFAFTPAIEPPLATPFVRNLGRLLHHVDRSGRERRGGRAARRGRAVSDLDRPALGLGAQPQAAQRLGRSDGHTPDSRGRCCRCTHTWHRLHPDNAPV